jgi:hypothetical protein
VFFSFLTQEVAVFAFLVLFLKHLLVPLNSTAPTVEDEQAFLDYEDESGNHGRYPSPSERHADAVEWRDGMCELRFGTLLRWRLAVAWMPFCGTREQRLIGERLSRRLFPDLYAERRKLRVRRAAEEARSERAEMYAELAAIKIEKEGF